MFRGFISSYIPFSAFSLAQISRFFWAVPGTFRGAGHGFLAASLPGSVGNSVDFPMVFGPGKHKTQKTMERSTIFYSWVNQRFRNSTGPFSSSQTVTNYRRVLERAEWLVGELFHWMAISGGAVFEAPSSIVGCFVTFTPSELLGSH